MATEDPWRVQVEALGAFIRAQRKLANLSLRELSALAGVSNPYLSQVERGLHQPSMRVLRSIGQALNVSGETLLAQAGLLEDVAAGEDVTGPNPVESAVQADPALSDDQKRALISVYRSYVTTD